MVDEGGCDPMPTRGVSSSPPTTTRMLIWQTESHRAAWNATQSMS